jgi:hypothetical protein
MLSNFSGDPDKENVALKILNAAKLEGYEKSLAHGQRMKWFQRLTPIFLVIMVYFLLIE